MATQTKERSKSENMLEGKGAMIGVAVAGLAVGLAANIGRKVVVQGMTAGKGDWAEGLKAEHQAALTIFDLLEQTTDEQAGKRTVLLTQMKHALSKHAFQEENVVYPAMREHGLTEEADHLNHDHGYVKQFLFELTEMERSNPAWLPKLAEFRSELEEHINEEEMTLFPKLHTALGEAGNKHVTTQMNKEGFKVA